MRSQQEGEQTKKLSQLMPLVEGKTSSQGESVAYICEKGVCRMPSYTAKDFAEQLKPD